MATHAPGVGLYDNDEDNYLEEVLSWCRSQEWWDVVQPVVAAGFAVDLHVPELPMSLVPLERQAAGVLAVCIRVVRPLPGVLVIRACERVHFQASRINADDNIDLIVAEMLVNEDDELDENGEPEAVNQGWD